MLIGHLMHEVLVGLSAATAVVSTRVRSITGAASSAALALGGMRGTGAALHLDFRALALPAACALLGFLMAAAAAPRRAIRPPARTRTR
jgi:hypothetical protein